MESYEIPKNQHSEERGNEATGMAWASQDLCDS